jgi:hypothetical protein
VTGLGRRAAGRPGGARVELPQLLLPRLARGGGLSPSPLGPERGGMRVALAIASSSGGGGGGDGGAGVGGRDESTVRCRMHSSWGGNYTPEKSFGVAGIRHVSQNARCSHLAATGGGGARG